MNDIDDTRPFPIQISYTGPYKGCKPCTIPWWLAEVVYAEYAKRFGTSQSIERLAERGGFGRNEVIKLLKGERFI